MGTVGRYAFTAALAVALQTHASQTGAARTIPRAPLARVSARNMTATMFVSRRWT